MKTSGAFIEIDPEAKRILSVYIQADSDVDERVVLEILKSLEDRPEYQSGHGRRRPIEIIKKGSFPERILSRLARASFKFS